MGIQLTLTCDKCGETITPSRKFFLYEQGEIVEDNVRAHTLFETVGSVQIPFPGFEDALLLCSPGCALSTISSTLGGDKNYRRPKLVKLPLSGEAEKGL